MSLIAHREQVRRKPVELVRGRTEHVPIESRSIDRANNAFVVHRHSITAAPSYFGNQRADAVYDLAGTLAVCWAEIQSSILIFPHRLAQFGTQVIHRPTLPGTPIHLDKSGIRIHWT